MKSKLEEIEYNKHSRISILRSKAKFLEEGETPTKYFFDLEKRNAIKKHINLTSWVQQHQTHKKY